MKVTHFDPLRVSAAILLTYITNKVCLLCTLHSLGIQVNKTPYFGRKVGYAHLQPRDPGGLKNYNNYFKKIHHST